MKRIICLSLGVASIAFGLFLLWGSLVLLIVPRTFESTAKLLVRSTFPPAPGWSIETDIQSLQSKKMLSQVITNLDLARRWGEKYKESALRIDTTYALLLVHLDIQRLTNSNIIEIRANSDDPNEAAAIANAVTQIAMTQLADPEGSTSAAKNVVYSLVEKATANPKPVRPSRLKRTAFPLGGFVAVFTGILLLICAAMIPKRSGPPPLRS